MTTKRLISNTTKSKHLSVDATYKLVFQGYPILLVGTTDRQKHFHPFGVAVTLNEAGADFEFVFNSLKEISEKLIDGFNFCPNKVIADGADAITNGFDRAFPQIFDCRVMCYAHVIRKIDAQLNAFTTATQKEIKKEIRKDISLFQVCESEVIFYVTLKLFFKKWRAIKSDLVDLFLNYFEKEWTDQLKGWFEGYAPGIPSTNNALESWNLIIKLEATFRHRHNLGKFSIILQNDMVSFWSKDRAPENVNCRNFENEVFINLQLFNGLQILKQRILSN